MDVETKTYYRNKIQEISKKTKISEIYITKKCLELSKKAKEKLEINDINDERKTHIGYYLIDKGRNELAKELVNKNIRLLSNETKVNYYIFGIWIITIILALTLSIGEYFLLAKHINNSILNTIYSSLIFIISIIPIENIVTKTTQYILSKIVKPKVIPKLDFQNGIQEEYATVVAIPTILNSKEKVKKLMEKLEVYYIANKSDNLYFTLLGDCTTENTENAPFDDEVIQEGIKQTQKLNEKYPDTKFPKFNFIYRKRTWNDKEEAYMGWERKRGALNQFNEYLLEKIKNPFRINTIENYKQDTDKSKIPNITYIITLDADTDLTLNSGLELVGAMAHILNRPKLNPNKDLVIEGHGLIQPRVGVGLLESRSTLFTQIYAGEGGTDSYTNEVSDTYQDNFDEGIFTGKGIYDLHAFSTILNNEIKENTVLSHDLLEGSYLRCGLASDIMLMDGYPTTYMSFKQRLYRWIRGDYQITLWLKNKIENRKGNRKVNPLNRLSKYKIFCNIVRSKQETTALLTIIISLIIRKYIQSTNSANNMHSNNINNNSNIIRHYKFYNLFQNRKHWN